ncbi:MAG: HD domain-containing protein [Candidatus Omnitrophica bacterium]|nr:HD domain-containing protein [Candidatus Omnitrophota bacterium]
MPEQTLPNLSPFIKILNAITKKNHVDAFLVGGALRDLYLCREVVDFDFATSKNAIKIAKIFAKEIKGAFVLLDEEHNCARVARKQKGKLLTFDFADFRAKDLKGDLSHRDFTINTISVDIKNIYNDTNILKQAKDYKKGLKDIRSRTIKMVSKKVFAEDPLRMLRGFSLQAVLDFKIEAKTKAQIKKDLLLISQVARERVREEFFKILSSKNAYKNLKQMHSIGLLERIIPQIASMRYISGGGYHHLSLMDHSFESVRQVEKCFLEFSDNEKVSEYLNEELACGRKRFALIKLAALLHDAGKPETYKKERNKITYHGHEHVGRYIVRNIAKMLKMSVNERTALEIMVGHHLRPGYLSNFKNPTPRAIFRFFRDVKEEAIGVLLLSLSDQRSTRGPLTTEKDQEHHEEIIYGLISKYFEEEKKEKKVRILTGDDLIKTLKLKPSPVFAKILVRIEEKYALGEIKTKKQALDIARVMIK